MKSINIEKFKSVFNKIGFLVKGNKKGVSIVEKGTGVVLVETKETEPQAAVTDLLNVLKGKATKTVKTIKFGSVVPLHRGHKRVFEEYTNLMQK